MVGGSCDNIGIDHRASENKSSSIGLLTGRTKRDAAAVQVLQQNHAFRPVEAGLLLAPAARGAVRRALLKGDLLSRAPSGRRGHRYAGSHPRHLGPNRRLGGQAPALPPPGRFQGVPGD